MQDFVFLNGLGGILFHPLPLPLPTPLITFLILMKIPYFRRLFEGGDYFKYCSPEVVLWIFAGSDSHYTREAIILNRRGRGGGGGGVWGGGGYWGGGGGIIRGRRLIEGRLLLEEIRYMHTQGSSTSCKVCKIPARTRIYITFNSASIASYFAFTVSLCVCIASRKAAKSKCIKLISLKLLIVHQNLFLSTC